MPKLSKYDYQRGFIALVHSYVAEDITREEFATSLCTLCSNYRKDYKKDGTT